MSGKIVKGDGRGKCRCECGCTKESGPEIYCDLCRARQTLTALCRMIVEFTIVGKIVSANLVTRHRAYIKWNTVDGVSVPEAVTTSYKPKEAEESEERIRALAIAAKVLHEWSIPERARVTVLAYNSRLDVGNIEKQIGDAIKGGILIVNDNPKHLKSLFVDHQEKDHLGERYVVQVEAVNAGLFG